MEKYSARGRKKQGPAAGSIWIRNNTTEQNTHLGIGKGARGLDFWLCNAASCFLMLGFCVSMRRQEKETTVSSFLIKTRQ